MTYPKMFKLLTISALGFCFPLTAGEAAIINYNELIEQEGEKIAKKYQTTLTRSDIHDDYQPYTKTPQSSLVEFAEIQYTSFPQASEKTSVIFERSYQNVTTSDMVVLIEKPIEYISDYFNWTLNDGIKIGKPSKIPCYFKGVLDNHTTIPVEMDLTTPNIQGRKSISQKEENATSMEIIVPSNHGVKVLYTLEQTEVKNIPFTLTLKIDGKALFHFENSVNLRISPENQIFEWLRPFDSSYNTRWWMNLTDFFEKDYPNQAYCKDGNLYHQITGTLSAFQGKKISVTTEQFSLSDLPIKKGDNDLLNKLLSSDNASN
jgi:hypothetical protein